MSTVTLTENYDLHVPDEVREALNLKPGEQFSVLLHDGRIEFLPVQRPVQHPRELRGFARGMDTTIDQEDDRL